MFPLGCPSILPLFLGRPTISAWYETEANHSALIDALRAVNHARALPTGDAERVAHYARAARVVAEHEDGGGDADETGVERWFDRPSTRLAVYGSLAPGEVNHHVVAVLCGQWVDGVVTGTLRQLGWGDHIGFPAITWHPDGQKVAVRLFNSLDLPAHWERIDTFEGEDYQRILVPVRLVTGETTVANIYEAKGMTATEI